MKNNEYNSLTQKLIQSGILQEESKDIEIAPDNTNFFSAKNSNAEIPAKTDDNKITIKRKRLNNYDLELLENADAPLENRKESNIQKIIYKFFPKLYEFKIAKDAIQKMTDLGIDADYLLNKTVPYGEGELRYKNLVKFIKYANEIQTKLKRKSKIK